MRDNKPDERSGTSSLQLLTPSAIDRYAQRRKGSITTFASSHDGHSSIDETQADHDPDSFNLPPIRRPKSDATSLTIAASHTHPDSDSSKLHAAFPDHIAPPPSAYLRRDTHSDAQLSNPGASQEPSPDLGPFAFDPCQLASLLDPKDFDGLQALGGITAILDGLGTHPTRGLLLDPPDHRGARPSHVNLGAGQTVSQRHGHHIHKPPGTAPDDSQPPSSTVGGNNMHTTPDPHTASFAGRKAVYGENILPQRPTTSLLGLMWLALKDKVLVRQCSAFGTPVSSHSH